MSKNFIIGLTGRFGAGSTTTANLILSRKEKDFEYFSLSQYVKDKAKKETRDFAKKKEKHKRVILQNIGDDLRQNESPSFLVDVLLERIEESLKKKNIIIDSIRNQEEVNVLRDHFSNFFLFAIDATTNNRWNRLKKLYSNDIEQFLRDDKRDAGGEDQPDYGQQVGKCMVLADVLINNDRDFKQKVAKLSKDSVEEYGQKVERYIKLIKKPGFKVPSFDELYMHHACSMALRSSCLRRQVGAVIVRESKKRIKRDNKKEIREIIDNYLIASGCNNAPSGADSCSTRNLCYREQCKNEYIQESLYCKHCGQKLSGKSNKCPNCKKNIWDSPSKILDLCQAIHAEEAAILQAAKLGISIDGSELYTSTFPCLLCIKKIIGSGIRKIIYLAPYPMRKSIEMLEQCGIVIQKYEGVNLRAFVRFFMREIPN